MLRTNSSTGIYCSSDKVGTVHLVKYIFENSSVIIKALCKWCENMLCCSSECILLSFMRAITFIMRSSNSSRVSTLLLHTSHFSQPL